MNLDNYLYFCPVTKTGKASDWSIKLLNFHGNIRIHTWFKRYEKVTVNVIQRLKKDIEHVRENIELGDELFPNWDYSQHSDERYKSDSCKFSSYDLDQLLSFLKKIDEIIEHRDCIGSLRYFAW